MRKKMNLWLFLTLCLLPLQGVTDADMFLERALEGQAQPTVLAGAPLVLQEDDQFAPFGLAPEGTHPNPHFAVVGQTIFCGENVFADGSMQTTLVAWDLDNIESGQPITYHNPLPSTLQRSSEGLAFWDSKERAITVLDENFAQTRKTSTGGAVVRSFGLFQNASILAASLNMTPEPVMVEEYFEGQNPSAQEIIDFLECCKDGAVFYLDNDFYLKHTVIERAVGPSPTNARVGRGRDLQESFKNSYRIRMNPSQTMAAVFSQHRRGITLVSETGEVIDAFTHPGKGRTITKEMAIARVLGPGNRGQFQTDVLLTEAEILVADTANRTFWLRRLDDTNWQAIEMPFDVLRIGKKGDWLYLLSQPRELHRFYYPE